MRCDDLSICTTNSARAADVQRMPANTHTATHAPRRTVIISPTACFSAPMMFRPGAACKERLVVQFQHSHPVAADTFANVGIEGPLENIDSSGALDLTFACEHVASEVANVKSAPLAQSWPSTLMQGPSTKCDPFPSSMRPQSPHRVDRCSPIESFLPS